MSDKLTWTHAISSQYALDDPRDAPVMEAVPLVNDPRVAPVALSSRGASQFRCLTSPAGSEGRSENQGTKPAGSVMSTILFDRARPSTVDMADECAAGARTSSTASSAAPSLVSSRHEASVHAPSRTDEEAAVALHEDGALAADDAHREAARSSSSSTTYVLQLNTSDHDSPRGTEVETEAEVESEARQLLFDDGDDSATTGPALPYNRADADEEEADMDSVDDDAMTTDLLGSPEPRLARDVIAAATSYRESGRRSDEGLVPSLARETSTGADHDHDHDWLSLTLHAAHLLEPPAGVAQTQHMEIALPTDAAVLPGTFASETRVATAAWRGADDTALVNSRSRTRGSSGSLALPPPPPPPQQRRRSSPYTCEDGMWATPSAAQEADAHAAAATVMTPSVERTQAARPRRLLPPPPPPPPPLESGESSVESTPARPPRPLRVLCAPSPSPPRAADETEQELGVHPSTHESQEEDEEEREATCSPPGDAPPLAMRPVTASISATASVLDMATTQDEDMDAFTDDVSPQRRQHKSQALSEMPRMAPLVADVRTSVEVCVEAAEPLTHISELEKVDASDLVVADDDEGGTRLASHVRPVGSFMPELSTSSPVVGEGLPRVRLYDIHAPLQASGSLCPANSLLPALDEASGQVRGAVPTTATCRMSVESVPEVAEAEREAGVATKEKGARLDASSPSPIRPSGESGSFASDLFEEDEEEGDDDGCGSSRSSDGPCLQPGLVAPAETLLAVFECGAQREPPYLSHPHGEMEEEEEVAEHEASMEEATTSSASSSSSFHSSSDSSHSPSLCSSRSFRESVDVMAAATTLPNYAETDMSTSDALRAALAREVDARLEKEEECAALHDLVEVLRGKLDTTTVAALAHHGDRHAPHSQHASLHHQHPSTLTESVLTERASVAATPVATAMAAEAAPSAHLLSTDVVENTGGIAPTTEGGVVSAEALLWQARHDQLAVELARVKQQLTEQKAVLDVLGLAPPYPPALLGAAKHVIRRLAHRTPPPANKRKGEDGDDARSLETTADHSALVDGSTLGTPVPIIATLYCRAEEDQHVTLAPGTASVAVVARGTEREDHQPGPALPWSARQERAASVARRALSELSANAVQLHNVARVLAKSRECSEQSETGPLQTPTTGGNVADALRRKKEQQQQQQQQQQEQELPQPDF